MRARLVATTVVVAALAALTAAAVALTARASSLPAPPAPITSPCLSVTVTPHVISAGGVVTARTGPGNGKCTQSDLAWNWFVNGVQSTTCGTSSTTCSITATRPTVGYRPICAVGTGPSAGLQACDYVAVVASGTYTITGRLTANSALGRRLAGDRPSLAGVGGAQVYATDSDGHTTTTTTNARGRYSLSVPRGRYTIQITQEPRRFYHGASTPESRTVVVNGDRRNINFTVGRVIELEGQVLDDRFSHAHNVFVLAMRFREHGTLVGGTRRMFCAAAAIEVVCTGRTRIDGIIGYPWLHVEWGRGQAARLGHGPVTSERIELGHDGDANYPSEDNQYEGSVDVYTGPMFNGASDAWFHFTVTLI